MEVMKPTPPTYRCGQHYRSRRSNAGKGRTHHKASGKKADEEREALFESDLQLLSDVARSPDPSCGRRQHNFAQFAQLIKGRDSPGKAPVVVCETAPRVNCALPFVAPVLTRMMHFGNPTQVSRRAHTNQLLSVLFTLTS